MPKKEPSYSLPEVRSFIWDHSNLNNLWYKLLTAGVIVGSDEVGLNTESPDAFFYGLICAALTTSEPGSYQEIKHVLLLLNQAPDQESGRKFVSPINFRLSFDDDNERIIISQDLAYHPNHNGKPALIGKDGQVGYLSPKLNTIFMGFLASLSFSASGVIKETESEDFFPGTNRTLFRVQLSNLRNILRSVGIENPQEVLKTVRRHGTFLRTEKFSGYLRPLWHDEAGQTSLFYNITTNELTLSQNRAGNELTETVFLPEQLNLFMRLYFEQQDNVRHTKGGDSNVIPHHSLLDVFNDANNLRVQLNSLRSRIARLFQAFGLEVQMHIVSERNSGYLIRFGSSTD